MATTLIMAGGATALRMGTQADMAALPDTAASPGPGMVAAAMVAAAGMAVES